METCGMMNWREKEIERKERGREDEREAPTSL